jgi:hypothetical protein
VDFAQLRKVCGTAPAAEIHPPVCIGCKRGVVFGAPDPEHVSASYAERAKLTMRMDMRRFTQLTNRFSKDAENHAHSIAIHVLF